MRNTKESKIGNIKTIANSKKVFCQDKLFVNSNNLQSRNYSNSTRCNYRSFANISWNNNKLHNERKQCAK